MGAGAWLGLCRAGRRGPVLGSIPRGGPNSTCLARCTLAPGSAGLQGVPPFSPGPHRPAAPGRLSEEGTGWQTSPCLQMLQKEPEGCCTAATDRWGWGEPWALGPSAPRSTPRAAPAAPPAARPTTGPCARAGPGQGLSTRLPPAVGLRGRGRDRSWGAATSLGETRGMRGDGAEVGAERSRERGREGERKGGREKAATNNLK